MGKRSGLGKFVFGMAVGAGIALLFAPQEGSKTRAQVKQKFDDLLERAKQIEVEEVKNSIENKIAEIQEDLADLDAEKVLAFAKDRAVVIGKKCDELVKVAAKKASPIVKATAEEARLTTISVLENTIAKLEKNSSKPTPKATTPKKKTTTKKK